MIGGRRRSRARGRAPRALVAGGAVLLLAAGGGAVRTAAEGGPVIDPEVHAAVARGPVRVLVELRLPDPAASGPSAVPSREQAIDAARRGVLARLSGTTYRLARQYTSVPLIALEIGPDALRALEGMGDLVSRVRAERVLPPAAPR